MTSLTMRLLAACVSAAPLWAQDNAANHAQLPHFRFDLSLGGGRLEHHTEQSLLDGEADAGFFRFAFEGIGDGGTIGGGVRLEGWASEDDLFTDAGFVATEATSASLFGHVTFRVETKRFVMPCRIGLLLHGYEYEEVATGIGASFGSFGPMIEVEPEFLLVRDGTFIWSLYGQVGFGILGTSIDIDTVGDDFESTSFTYGLELGTRIYAGHFVGGLGLVVRGQEVDQSDVKNGNFALGMDNSFAGLLFSVGLVF